MALLFIDGCDLYAVRTDVTRRWQTNGTSSSYINVTASGGRWGGGAIRIMSAGTGRITRTIPARPSVILGFAGYLAQPDQPGEEAFLVLYDGGDVQLAVHLDLTAGRFRLYRGFSSTLLAESDPITVASGVWSWFELKAAIDPTSGHAELRRDGTTLLSFTGDTRATAQSTLNGVQIRSLRQASSVRTDVWVDDVYIADDQGGANDDFLGDMRVSTLTPTADTAEKAWTPDSGGDNFARLAEIPPDDDSSYVASDLVGARDLYAMADLGLTPLTIAGLQHTALARKDDAAERSIALVLKSGATVDVGTEASLGSSYTFIEAMHENDPATGSAWTVAGIDALEAGMEVAS